MFRIQNHLKIFKSSSRWIVSAQSYNWFGQIAYIFDRKAHFGRKIMICYFLNDQNKRGSGIYRMGCVVVLEKDITKIPNNIQIAQ